MQRFFILILFLITACTGQGRKSSDKYQEIDTVGLLDPHPETGVAKDAEAALTNCVMLDGDSVAAVIAGERIGLKNMQAFRDMLQGNTEKIGHGKFYIIYAKGTSFKRIEEAIEIIKAEKIDNYKAVNLASLMDTLYEPKQ